MSHDAKKTIMESGREKKSNFKFPMKYKPNQIEKKTIINNSQKVYWKERERNVNI